MLALKLEDVWKEYRIPHEKRDSIFEHVAGALQILERERYTYESLWALRGLTLNLSKGESMGVIGDNGSGKSTLLKIIARIIRPTRGRVTVNGSVAPILELGVGFHPEVNVKDNALVYASIMGMSNAATKDRLDAILSYAGLERFRDAKLKNLSSGMQMRLAFSVATEVNPDIFLVDEALAVGDLDFQEKCFARFADMQRAGKSIILVSHSLELVRRFCPITLLLSKGEVMNFGPTENVLQTYLTERD
jgi:lipopolysaccharide transport system ATP-binding protein